MRIINNKMLCKLLFWLAVLSIWLTMLSCSHMFLVLCMKN